MIISFSSWYSMLIKEILRPNKFLDINKKKPSFDRIEYKYKSTIISIFIFTKNKTKNYLFIS